MNRKGHVYYVDSFAGVLEEDENGFSFTYDQAYLARKDSKPISLTLPLRVERFHDKTMLPFFDGLIPEGWLLDIVERNWKIDSRDRMGLLLACCQDCIGAVSVIEPSEDKRKGGATR